MAVLKAICKNLNYFADYPGPCQPFQDSQTSLCSEFQTLVQDYGPRSICNDSRTSCYVNVTRTLPSRKDLLWGNCYCDPSCKEIGDCCVDYDKW